MKIKETVAEIKQGTVHSIYLIAGADDYIRELAQKSILANLNIQMEELNVAVFRQGSEDLISSLEGLPMMSERRVVIVHLAELPDFLSEKLKSYLPQMPPTTVLLLIKPSKPDKNKPLEAYIFKKGCVIDCSEPAESEAVDFLCGYAGKHGLKLSRSDAHGLCQYVSGGLSHMVSELEKLIAVCNEQITTQDIQKYAVKSSDFNIFQLHVIFLKKKWDSARNLLNEILDGDPDPIGLISILSVNFELMLIARACADAGFREDQIKKNIVEAAGVAEFRAKLAIEQCRYMDAPSIRTALQKLSKLDFDSKQGNVVLKNDLYAVLCGIYKMA